MTGCEILNYRLHVIHPAHIPFKIESQATYTVGPYSGSLVKTKI